jgi:hypothetical protein
MARTASGSPRLKVMTMTFGDNGQVAERDSRRYTVRLTAERYAHP